MTQNVKSVTRSNSFFGFQGLEFTKAQVGVLNSKVYCIIVNQLLKLSVCEIADEKLKTSESESFSIFNLHEFEALTIHSVLVVNLNIYLAMRFSFEFCLQNLFGCTSMTSL